jgi:hypothetical protein
MTDDKAKGCKELESADSAYEEDFRKKSTYRSFMGALYSAIGGAAFIGVLGTLTNLALGTAAIAGGFTLGTGLLIGGLVIVGAGAIFLAQREYTELGCLQQDRFARNNAKAMGHQPSPSVEKSTEVATQLPVPAQEKRRFADTIQPRGKNFVEAATAEKGCQTCHSR